MKNAEEGHADKTLYRPRESIINGLLVLQNTICGVRY